MNARRTWSGLVAVGLAAVLLPGGRAGAAADTTPPWIKMSRAGQAGSAGWFIGDVTVSWKAGDPQSGIAKRVGCGSAVVAKETPGTSLTCTATNKVGLQRVRTTTVRLDKTPPAVTAAPSRPPDSNGWYNHPLTVSFSGTDATSGVASCTSVDYGGPDGTNASVTGSCVDRAGLVAPSSFALKYDATPTAAVTALRAQSGNHKVTLEWQLPPEADFDHVAVTRIGPLTTRVIYQGVERGFADTAVANGYSYAYSVVSYDRAANASAPATAAAIPKLVLLVRPSMGARVSSPPLLRWLARPRAAYYNVQLWRNGGKILSTWPVRRWLSLRWRWRFGRHLYRLKPGVYRWFVWPGYGPRRPVRYGRLLGTSTFVVIPRNSS